MKVRSLLLVLFLAVQVYAKYSVGYYYAGYSATHIAHAFIGVDGNGGLYNDSWFPYPDIIKTAHQNGTKVIVSIGGYGNCAGFTPMTSTAKTRKAFIINITNFCKTNGYDGIDLDWEYPKSSDRQNFVSLVKELRASFDSSGIESISIAMPSTDWNSGYDIASLKNYVTWFGVMTYDFSGPWESAAFHNSPLYSSSSQSGSWDESMNYYLSKGVPKEKLLAGMAFYGYKLKASGIYASHTLNEGSSITYLNANAQKNSGWKYVWDDQCKVPYLINSDKTYIITYDDTNSIKQKCDYIINKGLGGIIIWKIGMDYSETTAPLFTQAGRILKVGTGLRNDEPSLKPKMNYVLKNYPNPFNPSTVISFTLPKSGYISLKVYDMLGKEAAVLINGEYKNAGSYNTLFNAAGLASGIYFCILNEEGYLLRNKLELIK
jgi:chitinase